MGRRDLILGVLVAAAIAAAVYVTGNRAGTVAGAGDGAGSAAGELPNLSVDDARLEIGSAVVLVRAPARPILAFERNRLLFRFEGVGAEAGQPASVESAAVSFTMRMDMGKHRYALVPTSPEGWLQAEFVLPACPSGGRRWYGILTFELAGRKLETRFAFDLEPRSG